MKLLCDCEVVNKLLPLMDMRQKSRTSRSKVCIGKKQTNCDDVYLVVYTMNDSAGTFFKIMNNVDKVHKKFMKEGKATITLKEPPTDIFIRKSIAVKLEAFLQTLFTVMKGNKTGVLRLSNPMTRGEIDSLKRVMTVTSRQDYPVTCGFPESLESLYVTGCALKKIDLRIFQLKRLTLLDLSDNNISTLPDDWSHCPSLLSLSLESNALQVLPLKMFRSSLQATLKILNVSNNSLKYLPRSLVACRDLQRLQASNNDIRILPFDLGNLPSLSELKLQGNKLQSLPWSVCKLKICTLDLAKNPWCNGGDQTETEWNRLGVPSLLEVAGRVIKVCNIPYSPKEVSHLVNYLDSAKVCICGKMTFDCNVKAVHRMGVWGMALSSWTYTPNNQDRRIPVEGYLCSFDCLERFNLLP